MLKERAFDLLDEWFESIGEVREKPTEAAIDLADELDITYDRARELVSRWIEIYPYFD